MTGNGRKSDFIIAVDSESPPLINLVGIESPGLSAALALARYVGELPCIQKRFNPSRAYPPLTTAEAVEECRRSDSSLRKTR